MANYQLGQNKQLNIPNKSLSFEFYYGVT